MDVKSILTLIFSKCALFENASFLSSSSTSPSPSSTLISKSDLSSHLQSQNIPQDIITSFITLIFDDLGESTDTIPSNDFISKYITLLQLIDQSPPYNNLNNNNNNNTISNSISKISTRSTEKDRNSLMKDIQKDIDSLKKLSFTPMQIKIKNCKALLPINYLSKEKKNTIEVQVLLRSKFDVQEHLSAIHRRNDTAMNRFINNSVNNVNVNYNRKKIKQQSYSITHQIVDVFDHLNEVKPIQRQSDYFYLAKKDKSNKLLNTLTTRFNIIVKKEKEKDLRNELKMNTKGNNAKCNGNGKCKGIEGGMIMGCGFNSNSSRVAQLNMHHK